MSLKQLKVPKIPMQWRVLYIWFPCHSHFKFQKTILANLVDVIFEYTLLGSYGAPYGDSYGAPAYAPAPANPVGYSFYPNFSNGLNP